MKCEYITWDVLRIVTNSSLRNDISWCMFLMYATRRKQQQLFKISQELSLFSTVTAVMWRHYMQWYSSKVALLWLPRRHGTNGLLCEQRTRLNETVKMVSKAYLQHFCACWNSGPGMNSILKANEINYIWMLDFIAIWFNLVEMKLCQNIVNFSIDDKPYNLRILSIIAC